MGVLDDTAIFVVVIQQGGFSHAAKQLGLSNGMVSRRIAALEETLGVTLLKRTTRQIHLTPEGELLLQHAQRISQEFNSAVSLIQSSSKKPRGLIRVSAPLYFGRNYLTPIIMKFMHEFPDITIDLQLSNQRIDPIKMQFDLVIRGAGYLESIKLKDSSFQVKTVVKEKIGLYASPAYLLKKGEPEKLAQLTKHSIIHYADNNHFSSEAKWGEITVHPTFSVNDIESSLMACISGYGIGKFTDLNVKNALQQQQLKPILQKYDWGSYHLYAIYPQQKALPKRTRLLLDFICANVS